MAAHRLFIGDVHNRRITVKTRMLVINVSLSNLTSVRPCTVTSLATPLTVHVFKLKQSGVCFR